mmetsp:Transcript_4804/g.11633  ORF Transcript_4804/g.11633 Transcript_4804/m.11633 type:complete len:89 (-) Transcript_4804:525-791(-)
MLRHQALQCIIDELGVSDVENLSRLLADLPPGCPRFALRDVYHEIQRYIKTQFLAAGALIWLRSGLLDHPEPSNLSPAGSEKARIFWE